MEENFLLGQKPREEDEVNPMDWSFHLTELIINECTHMSKSKRTCYELIPVWDYNRRGIFSSIGLN